MGAMITGKSIFNISHKEAFFVITFDLVKSKISNYQIVSYREQEAMVFNPIYSLPFNGAISKQKINDPRLCALFCFDDL
tara:strand:- start:6509 stop:6745 length:237 start_codon:yes stop_codon:yes gene_type:complete